MIDFVSLHNHSSFSILDALSSPKDLFYRAKELGQSALAITDHGTFSAALDSLKASRETGVKLIIGCEYYFQDDATNRDGKMRHVILLAKNAIGYKNILTINYKGFDNRVNFGNKVYSVIDWKLLEKYNDGVICLTACSNGIIGQLLMKQQFDRADETAIKLKSIFGEDLGFEIQANNMKRLANLHHDELNQIHVNNQIIKLANKHNIKIVPTTNTHYAKKEQAEIHDALLAIGSHQSIFSNFRLKYPVHDFYLKTGEEMVSFFERNLGEEFAKELCANTIYFADKCEMPDWIEPKFSNPSGKELPIFPVKDEKDYQRFVQWSNNYELKDIGEDNLYLRFKCESALINGNYDETYKARYLEEIEVLEHHGFSSYMLIVADYINWAKKSGISVGPGRGCLTGDTLVYTDNGIKELKNILVGDYVYTHTGCKEKVINKFRFNIENEKLIRLKTDHSFNKISMTSDHKVFASKNTKEAPSWVPCSKLCIGDYVFTTYPINNNADMTKKVDLSQFNCLNYQVDEQTITCNRQNISNYSIRQIQRSCNVPFEFIRKLKMGMCSNNLNGYKEKVEAYLHEIGLGLDSWKILSAHKQYTISRFIDINAEFLYFIGRWVGDGCFIKDYAVNIAFNSKDIDGIARIKKYLEGLGFYVQKRLISNGSCIHLQVNSQIFTRYLMSIFDKYRNTSHTKHLPCFYKNLSNNQLKHLLLGVSHSDGSINVNGERIKSTSKSLVLELKESLLYLHVASGVHIEEFPCRNGKINKAAYVLSFSGLNTKPSIRNRLCTGYYSRISAIETCNDNFVYDITVNNDHSYLTTNFVVHNSVGGSLIAFLLDIHKADPIKYNLIFARFHNKEKSTFPDIDVDFAPSGREKIRNYLCRKYGEEHVAHVSNVNTITPKVYARDIARACEFGGSKESAVKIGTDIADSISSDIDSIGSALQKSPLFSEYANKYQELKKYSEIGGKYRAWSTHAGGIVVSNRPLVGLVPVRRDKEGVLVLEYDKERAEESGLVKMDILGLSTLDTIDRTMELIQKNGKSHSSDNIDYDKNDEKTYDLISSGNTFCVFQLGTSGGTIDLCKKIKPKNIEDISHINSLARPSSRDIRNDFVSTKEGKRPVILMHQSLSRAFGFTYGFGLYEESLMYLAQDVAGWSLHEADRLRKLTKEKGKNPKKALQWRSEFISGGVKNNISEDITKNIWDEVVEKFSGYGFNHCIHYLELVDIFTQDGTFVCSKQINQVVAGEYVRSRDESAKQEIFVQVLNVIDNGQGHLIGVELMCGTKIKCTIEHKFRVEGTGDMLPLHQIIKEDKVIVVNPYDKAPSPIHSHIKSYTILTQESVFDLEVDHPDHQFYLANGMLTSNSHSVLYSMLSYQTAYLKAHFPVEFLLANLIEEVKSKSQDAPKNINKIKQEIRRNRITILPPDINESALSYSMTTNNRLLTGLDALKFVSNDAIMDIISKRPFVSFFDFMLRVDAGKVRSNTIQALAACGCLDSFKISRKSMHLYCSDYRKKLTTWLKKHDVNTETFSYPWEDKQEWDMSEIYAMEHFYLGEAFICKPNKAYKDFFTVTDKSNNYFTVQNLKKAQNKDRIRLVKAIVRGLFSFKIKKEKSKYYGQVMMKVDIEDVNGERCTLTIFPDRVERLEDAIKKASKKKVELADGFAISFSATANLYEDEMGLILDDVYQILLPPQPPADLKAKKVSLKNKSIIDESLEILPKEQLLEEVQSALADEGLIEIEN